MLPRFFQGVLILYSCNRSDVKDCGPFCSRKLLDIALSGTNQSIKRLANTIKHTQRHYKTQRDTGIHEIALTLNKTPTDTNKHRKTNKHGTSRKAYDCLTEQLPLLPTETTHSFA